VDAVGGVEGAGRVGEVDLLPLVFPEGFVVHRRLLLWALGVLYHISAYLSSAFKERGLSPSVD
jgi:hypothetical protein